jgi:transcriptional regulator with XRE-family HTH domain
LKDSRAVKCYLLAMQKNANYIIGQAIRQFREHSGLSQEKLAATAGITYQYLSAVENGKENFTVGVLDALAQALELPLDALVGQAYADTRPTPTVDAAFFIPRAKLPPGLKPAHIEAVLNETHRILRLINATLRQATGRPLSAYIQGNNFSGIVSNILTDAFSRLTPYKNNHDQKYPDLICSPRGGRSRAGLEVKATIQKGKGGESHNGHAGWHVVACFEVDAGSGDIRFVHVMFADLVGHGQPGADWKYVGSRVNSATGSQRTETYNTTATGTAKLRHGSVYLDTGRVNIARWRTDPSVPAPRHSPFRSSR